MEDQSSKSKQILVFSAHPDDHVCCAGTLMYLHDHGYETCEVVATDGELGTWWDEEGKKKTGFDKNELASARKKEISKASEIIGTKEIISFGLPDSQVQKSYEVVERVMKIIREKRPEIIFAHNPVDYHSDHVELSRIVSEAAERASWTYLPELGESYKVPTLLYMEGFYFGKADLVFDITQYLERKKSLVDVYASQMYPSERRLLEAMNDYRGFFLRDHAVLAAEAFEIPRQFPVNVNKLLEFFAKK